MIVVESKTSKIEANTTGFFSSRFKHAEPYGYNLPPVAFIHNAKQTTLEPGYGTGVYIPF